MNKKIIKNKNISDKTKKIEGVRIKKILKEPPYKPNKNYKYDYETDIIAIIYLIATIIWLFWFINKII